MTLTWENAVMGYSFAGGGDGDQLFLLPPDPRDWLPPGHLAWELRALVAGMDLSAFLSWYRADGQGRPAYHPQLMVTLIGYCYCKGLRSSRAIEMATFDDVGARVICANLHPDHSTIARFVTRHERAVKGLLVASLVACARQGLVSVDVVAGDGTMIRANASMGSNATAARLETEIAGLEVLIDAEVGRWLVQAREADAAEDALFSGEDGDDQRGAGGGGTSRELARLTGKLTRRRKAAARLAAAATGRLEAAQAIRGVKIARLQQRAERADQRAAREEAACQARVEDYQRRAAAKAAAGSRKRPDGRAPVSPADSGVVRRARRAAARARQDIAALAEPAAADADPQATASTTDPASRLLPAKHGGYLQGYNTQVIAGKHQIILGIATHDNPADTSALHPLLATARTNLDAAGIPSPIRAALFDAGYASDANFTAACDSDLYVSVSKEARQTGRLRDGKERASALPSWQAMTAKLATPDGQALYKQRSPMIEPVFAQLFSRLGRDLHYRDTKVDLELHLWAATHNFLKAIRKTRREQAPPTPAPAA
jgi:transposase